MVLDRIKHPQVRATSRSINNAAIIKFGSYERSATDLSISISTSEAVFLGLIARKCIYAFIF